MTHNAITLESLGLSFTLSGPHETNRDGWQCYGWILSFSKKGTTERFDFFTGTGLVDKRPKNRSKGTFWVTPIKPNPLEVLSCIACDYIATDRVSFSDWCADFGYSSDSIKMRATYDACRETGLRLLNLILVSEMEALASLEF